MGATWILSAERGFRAILIVVSPELGGDYHLRCETGYKGYCLCRYKYDSDNVEHSALIWP